MFGEISALLGIPHTATVKVLTPCRACVVSDAATFLKSRPDLAHAISRLLAQRLHAVTSYLSNIKTQFQEQQGHLSMVDEVLETLLHQQAEDFSPPAKTTAPADGRCRTPRASASARSAGRR